MSNAKTRAQALNQLERLFRLGGSWASKSQDPPQTISRENVTNGILEILTQYPELCLEHFQVEDEQWGFDLPYPDEDDENAMMELEYGLYYRRALFTPLTLFIWGKVDFAVIEKVANLNPDALLHINESRYGEVCPLHVAVTVAERTRRTRDAQIIVFLARKCPEALKMTGPQGKYPLEAAFRFDRYARLYARQNDYYRSLIPLLVEYPDASASEGHVISPRGLVIQLGWEQMLSNLECANEIAKMLFPQLNSVGLNCHGWTKEGLNYFLKKANSSITFLTHLEANSSITTMAQVSLPFCVVSISPKLRALFSQSAHARSPSTSREQFVEMLLAVPEEAMMPNILYGLLGAVPAEETMMPTILYRLLREMPSLWCQNAVDAAGRVSTRGKRKRSH